MTDHDGSGLKVTVSPTMIGLCLVYPDGSQLQLAMPKPAGIETQTSEQVEALARRMARRLLGAAIEDVGAATGA